MAGPRFVYGVTLGQIDRLNALMSLIRAHGDVFAASDHAHLERDTLSRLGEAVFEASRTVRTLLDEIERQRLVEAGSGRTTPATAEAAGEDAGEDGGPGGDVAEDTGEAN